MASLRMIVAALALVSFGALVDAEAPRAATDRPNIIMLFVDDLGYGDPTFNGHPTTETPNIDDLAHGGKILSSWYSGCPVCSGSRASLMTGRQYTRVGVPGVFGPTVDVGLPLNETTMANQLKKAGYSTGIMGKWHLGQRSMFLPAARGFDEYLGIPYSDDMGEAKQTPCPGETPLPESPHQDIWEEQAKLYHASNFLTEREGLFAGDPAGSYLPLVYQKNTNGTVNTTVLEQPLDFTTLAQKYNDFVENFVADHSADPFFLYMPFSHVHTTAGNQPEKQYAGCQFRNTTRRGKFGDALKEADWIVGNVVAQLAKYDLQNNTLIFFTGDNGPWMIQGSSGGSEGLFTGRFSGYWNTGKGCTWDGGIHEAGFAHWPGMIEPNTRTAEVVSSMDVFPTVSKIAGVPLPTDRIYDGREMTDVLFNSAGKSQHDFLFFYGSSNKAPDAVRYGKYKAHWITRPGLGGCDNCSEIKYEDPPLLFNIEEDPSEAYPLTKQNVHPSDPEIKAVVDAIQAAYQKEVSTFVPGKLVPPPDGPGEGPGKYGVCCDRTLGCDCNGKPSAKLPWM